MLTIAAAEKALKTTFGFDSFRSGQAEIISAILSGDDVMAVMPTGSGKSLCYQLPAILRDGLTVVVSPLISLMRNQVAQLRSYGIAAASLNSANSQEEGEDILNAMARNELRLVYVSPERLARADTLRLLKRSKVGLLAVDEAHCISQWGHDFRPEYMTIGSVQTELDGVQIIALTATADASTRADILSKLFKQPPKTFVHGFDRPNLRLTMRPKASARTQILDFVEEHRGDSGIVYCSSRRQTEELADFLCQKGFRALPYHAGMEPGDRSRHQDIFLQEDSVIVVATVAFGMGIDKPDVRFVCHASLPKNIEGYYQEIGRAGRDGLPADTLTLYGLDDIRLRRVQIQDGEASEQQKRIEQRRLAALVSLCEAPRCRRQTLLAYFGETSETCGNCDLCLEGIEVIDGTTPARKLLSAIARTGERFGTEHLIGILCGDRSDAIVKFRHQDLPTFGVGQENSKQEWRSIVRQLYAGGVIALDISGFGSWAITEFGRTVLKGEATIELRRETLTARNKGGRKSKAGALKNLPGSDQALFQALREQRLSIAKTLGVPAYVVFGDRSLSEMAQHKPVTREQMSEIYGVGQAKLAQYGDVFLKVIRDCLTDNPA